jgi:hypothetical protein
MLTEDEITALCTAGAMAPSGGNEQPWRVSVDGSRLLIGPDDQHSDNSFLDVDGYAAGLAIGCFAENVAITARTLGLEYAEESRDGTTRFTFTGRQAASPHRLAESITRRVTNRRPWDGTALTDADLEPLMAAVDTALDLTAVSDPHAKAVIGRALGTADVLRMRNTTMFTDMTREMCWTDRETAARRDGLDLRTLELPGATVKLLSLLRRVPRLRLLLPARKLAETARLLVQNTSHICCLSTRDPLTRETMTAAGRSLQRLWLEATHAGLSVHPWTVGTLLLTRQEEFHGRGFTADESQQVRLLGQDLRRGFGLLPQDRPVFVFRLFKSPPPSARSLRRPWQSFTTMQESSDEAR